MQNGNILRQLAVGLVTSVAGTTTLAVPGNDAWANARDAYEVGHFRLAVAGLRRAAEAGNADAAQVLGTMLLAGPALYGAQVPRDPSEAQHWLRAAAAQGHEVARFQLSQLAKRDVDAARRAGDVPADSPDAHARSGRARPTDQ